MADDMFQGLKKLRMEYLENIRKESEKILKNLQVNPKIDEKYIRNFAHQISGSGTSYGFDFITDIGITISALFKKGTNQEELSQALDRLIRQIRKTEKDLSSFS